jgi:two-component system response regulator HydG
MKRLEPAETSPEQAVDDGEGLRVLVVDDNELHAEGTAEALQAIGYECVIANSGKAGARKIESEDFDVILTDLRMPDLDGLALLRKVKEGGHDAQVVVITGHSDVKSAVEAMRQGAANFLTKPVGLPELRAIVDKAAQDVRRNRALRQLRRQLDARFGFEGVIGDSKGMHDALERMKKFAPTPVPVLIQGETGTGKELVAKAIHNNSPRKNRPFLEINCTATTEHLLDDLLFGHERGAFTGAERMRKGVFEEANGGTLFLDEIGDMPLNLQAKLLKVLEDQKVFRIGSNDPIQVNVRVLSATYKDLEAAVASKEFRNDLYFRLKVVTIKLPPLRERREDLVLLVWHFIKEFGDTFGKPVERVDDTVIEALKRYSWPGNVRELRNLIQGMVVLDTNGVLGLDDLRAADTEGRFQGPAPAPSGPDTLIGRPLKEVERYYIKQTLERTGGNREEAAKLLGIGERTLYRVIRDWKKQDQIKEALEAAGGNLAEAARRVGLSEATLARTMKQLGMTEGV